MFINFIWILFSAYCLGKPFWFFCLCRDVGYELLISLLLQQNNISCTIAKTLSVYNGKTHNKYQMSIPITLKM